MTVRRVEIEAGPTGTAAVRLDGVDVARYVQSFDLHAEAGRMATVTLHLVGSTIYQGEAGVVLPEWLHEALVALGWTPPKDGA
jgi:hypothetical protein